MPLEEYRRKRDFAKTPEPAPASTGGAAPPGSIVRRRFVVQRHRATRLHYDFRLEIDGVLASWAVPKGPTLDPSIRRMAVHVEDHPLEYFDFEGVIPAKQYGAGDVIVWDWGTWEPEAETPDPAAAVANGELKFVLSGEKVTGRYTIVRTSRRPGTAPSTAFEDDEGEQWLLIHKRGADNVKGWDAEDHPRSVKSGRTNDDVKANAPAIWVSAAPASTAEIDLSAAREAPMPRYLEPMKATLATAGVPRRGLAVRAQVGRLPGRGRRPRRQGRAVHPQRPRRRGVLPAAADPADVDRGARGDRRRRGRGARRARAPGLLAAPGADQRGADGAAGAAGLPGLRPALPRRPLARRRAPRVAQAAARARDPAELAGPVGQADRDRGARVLRRGQGAGPRGHRRQAPPVALRAGPPHLDVAQDQGPARAGAGGRRLDAGGGEPRRSWAPWSSASTTATGCGSRARSGSGFDGRTRKELRGLLDGLETDAPAFDPPPAPDYRGRWGGDLAGVRWIRPELVIRAEIGGWTRDGHVRQTAFKGLERGRDPREVVRERAVDPAKAERAAAEALPAPAEEVTPMAEATRRPRTRRGSSRTPSSRRSRR